MEEGFQTSYLSEESYSPKRDRDDLGEEEISSAPKVPVIQSKRLRKIKPLVPPVEKERTRGRYACLGHRMKHKRCPLDCPDRRPKAGNDQMEGTTEISSPKEEKPPSPIIKSRSPRNSAKKNILKLEECSINKSSVLSMRQSHGVSIPSVSRDHRDVQNWDSVAWEGLSWDEHSLHCLRDDTFIDLKSSSHWEESKSRCYFDEQTKQVDYLTKFEEDEIIDSWLNEDGFSTNTQDLEIAEKNPSDIDTERRDSPNYTTQCLNSLFKILLTRDMVERWLTEPYFNRLVKGCLVRVQVGEYMGSPIYKIAHIEDVFDTCYHPYNLSRGGQTTKGLSLHVAASKRIFPILSISNHLPTEQDFRNWQEEMERSGIILDPLELQQKEEIIRVLHLKYPMEFVNSQLTEPVVTEPAIWSSC